MSRLNIVETMVGCLVGVGFTQGYKTKGGPKSKDHSDQEHDFGPHKISWGSSAITSKIPSFGSHVRTLGSFLNLKNKAQ